jgi:hypothetical protein
MNQTLRYFAEALASPLRRTMTIQFDEIAVRE